MANAGPEADVRQAAHRVRAAQPHLARQHARRHLAHAGKLAGAAGQHDAIAGGARQSGAVQPVLARIRRSLPGADG